METHSPIGDVIMMSFKEWKALREEDRPVGEPGPDEPGYSTLVLPYKKGWKKEQERKRIKKRKKLGPPPPRSGSVPTEPGYFYGKD
jgi:hypothetical protein